METKPSDEGIGGRNSLKSKPPIIAVESIPAWGVFDVHNSHITIPNENTSTFSVIFSGFLTTSGAVQGSVLQIELDPLAQVCRLCFANPKSQTFNVICEFCPIPMSVLLLLKSKCTILRECKYSIPLAASRARLRRLRCPRAHGWRSKIWRSDRSTYSVTIAGDRWPCTTPYTRTTFGCCKLEMSWASRQKSATCAAHSERLVML
mmetsp:Transcript_12764/g.17430  ORF Transcript_12764/g.17430 Transcript_12764/m.17430 type:complete len:205 (-) Transcript_12764:1762-2376(-)